MEGPVARLATVGGAVAASPASSAVLRLREGPVFALDEFQDYALMFILAAALGAVGGLSYELMLTRRRETGMFERPRVIEDGRAVSFWELGGFASIIVGAVSAVAALWVFPPELVIETAVDGVTSATRQLDLVKVVGLSVVVGSAGASFLGSLQSRALTAVKSPEAAAAGKVGGEGRDVVVDSAS